MNLVDGRRLCSSFEPAVRDERDRFRASFPDEAPSILDSFERIISRGTKEASLVGQTVEGTHIFKLNKAVRVGGDVFILEIIYKVDITSTSWVRFRWVHHLIQQPNLFSPCQTLEEILDSLSRKDPA